MRSVINFFDGYVSGENIWFSNLNFNALQKVNIHTGKVDFIATFPDISPLQRNLHIRTVYHHKRLYFIPYDTHFLHIWNLEKSQWESPVQLLRSPRCITRNVILHGDELWLFPHSIEYPIQVMNLSTQRTEDLMELTAKMKTVFGSGKLLSSCGVALQDNLLFILNYLGNTVAIVDSITKRLINYCSFGSVSLAGIMLQSDQQGWLWLSDSSDVLFWNIQENYIRRISTQVPSSHDCTPFSNILSAGSNKLLLLPWQTGDPLIYDIFKDTFQQLELPVEFSRCNVLVLFFCSATSKHILYLFPSGGNQLLAIDTRNMSLFPIDFILSDDFYQYAVTVLKQQFTSSLLHYNLQEGQGWSHTLPDFLDWIAGNTNASPQKEDLTIGTRIHNTIKNLLK